MQGVGQAFGNMAVCCQRMGHFEKAMPLYQQSRAIAEVMGNQPLVAITSSSLGACHTHLREYDKAITCYTRQYEIARELELKEMVPSAALGVGVAMRLWIQSDRTGPGNADGCLCDAQKWLETAGDCGWIIAQYHLALLAFGAGQEDKALCHLREYLSLCVQEPLKTCTGCHRVRGEHVAMLICSGCSVAKFCNADHKKMASNSVASGGGLSHGRHQDICALLGKWKKVVKDGVPPESCAADLLAFLQR